MMHKPFAYFGTPYVARDTLAILLEHGYTPSVVISSPDAPRGRGMVLTPSETTAFAHEKGLTVHTPEKLDTAAIEQIRSYGCEYAVVVAYGKILPQALIDAFPLGVLNIHYSLLPQYRGASPVEAALLHGDTVTGVAIQRMTFALDAGDVLRSVEVPIESTETTRELRPRLVTIGANLLVDTLPAFEDGSLVGTPQDHANATYAGRIRKEDGELSLTGNDQTNWYTYRAFAESPGTYFFMRKDGVRIRVKIKTGSYVNEKFIPLRVVPEGKKETDYQLLRDAGWIPS